MNATAMDLEHNGDGRRWSAQWQLDGDGRRNVNSTERDGAMVTRWRWTMRNGASATAMLAQPVVGGTKANAASKHKM